MKKRWIAVLGVILIGFVIGCDQGQTVTKPDPSDIPKNVSISVDKGVSASTTPEGEAKGNQE